MNDYLYYRPQDKRNRIADVLTEMAVVLGMVIVAGAVFVGAWMGTMYVIASFS